MPSIRFFHTAWPLTHAIPWTNFWHSMPRKLCFCFFNSETSLDLIPNLAFSTVPQTAERSGICQQHQDWNEKPRILWTPIDHEIPVLWKHSLWDSPTKTSVSIPQIDVYSPQQADLKEKNNQEGKGGKQPPALSMQSWSVLLTVTPFFLGGN